MTSLYPLTPLTILFAAMLLVGLAVFVLLAFLLILRALLSPHPTAGRQLQGFVCPFCHATQSPRAETRVSPFGWILVGWLPLLLSPLGGLARERWRVCRCGVRFGLRPGPRGDTASFT